MQFIAKDHDNDTRDNNCVQVSKGALWYKSCLASNLNRLYLDGRHASYADGVDCGSFKGHYYSLKRTEMKFKNKKLSSFQQINCYLT